MPKRYTVKMPTKPLVKSKLSHYGRLLHDLGNQLAKAGHVEDFGQPDNFVPPDYQPIQIPAQFATYEQRQVFTVAVHEVGHGLMELLQCNEVTCLTVHWANSCAIGSSMNNKDLSGHPGAIVNLAGLAAQQLVEGMDDDCSGAATDIRMAKQNLRDAGFDERSILPEMVAIIREVQRIFTKDWLPGIKAAAIELATTGMISQTQFISAVATAQTDARNNGILHKAMHDLIDANRFAK